MIPFKNRFHGHNSLRYVYKNGRAERSHFATVKSSPNPNRSQPRLAVVISKKVLKSAVRRNRIRRRIYEYVRVQFPRLNDNYDIVVIVSSSELLAMHQTELVEQLESLLEASELYKPVQI
jgi:ribonuclease P protein component